MSKKLSRVIILLLSSFCLPLQASDVVDDKSYHENLSLLGQGYLRVLFWDVYESRLYTKSKQYQLGASPVMLEIKYLRDISKDALVEQTKSEWLHLGLSEQKIKPWLERLDNILPNIRKHDLLSLYIDEDNHSVFRLNHQQIAMLKDVEFGHQFLSIWLSENTSRPDQRLALLGKSVR